MKNKKSSKNNNKLWLPQHSLSFHYDQFKFKLIQSQDNFFLYYDILKDKMKKQFSDALKRIEKDRIMSNKLNLVNE
jgi:hypothetical protein